MCPAMRTKKYNTFLIKYRNEKSNFYKIALNLNLMKSRDRIMQFYFMKSHGTTFYDYEYLTTVLKTGKYLVR